MRIVLFIILAPVFLWVAFNVALGLIALWVGLLSLVFGIVTGATA